MFPDADGKERCFGCHTELVNCKCPNKDCEMFGSIQLS